MKKNSYPTVVKNPTNANRKMNTPVTASKKPSPANRCMNPALKGKITKK